MTRFAPELAPAGGGAPAVVVFTDLDDTLFQTEDKARRWAGREPLRCAATDRAGAPLSFHAPAQLAMLHLLRDATLIPVTGRNDVALARVTSPVFTSYTITGHGAVVRAPGRREIAAWMDAVRPRANAMQAPFADLEAHLLTAVEDGARVRVIRDAALPAYLSIKASHAGALPSDETLRQACAAAGVADWTLHRNGRNVALLPPYACKAKAVAFVMERIREAAAGESAPVFIGLGDSHTDGAFLRLCDFAITPRHCQLQEVAWS